MGRPHLIIHSLTNRCWGFTVVSDPAMDIFFGMNSCNLLSLGHILTNGLFAVLVSFLST